MFNRLPSILAYFFVTHVESSGTLTTAGRAVRLLIAEPKALKDADAAGIYATVEHAAKA
jgi:hypothetical protein